MTTIYQDRPLGAPVIDAANEPFWRAAAQGSLLIGHCPACGKHHWYPRPLCPYCLSDTEWQQASGHGTVYSISVTRKAGPIAYAIAYVRLEEGVTMLTNIVDADLDAVRIGDRVRVCFKPAEGGHMVPMFTPA
ncbi:hypothetical protein D9M68_338750 [compost metagenome]